MKIKKGFELRDICGEKVIMATGIENVDFNQMIALNEICGSQLPTKTLMPIRLPPYCAKITK